MNVEKHFTSEHGKWVKYFFNSRRDILCLPCYMFVLFFVINTNEILYQNISLLLMDFRLLKSVIYYVTIVMMIIPHAKIACYFHVWRYHVFLWKLTWNLFGVYIISNYILFCLLALSTYGAPGKLAVEIRYRCNCRLRVALAHQCLPIYKSNHLKNTCDDSV